MNTGEPAIDKEPLLSRTSALAVFGLAPNVTTSCWPGPKVVDCAASDDTEGLIDHIRAIEPVVVACVFEEIEPELTRISLRSKSDRVNVNEIAAQFGGGGHPAAAGARIPGNPLSVQRKVIAAVRRALGSTR